jgi:uncharacterized protein YndB with AHSA1/START domain
MSKIAASESELRLERLIPSPPELLFALWTEPDQLARWWAPQGYEALVHTLDPTPGGCWRISLRGADNRLVSMSGAYRIVDPPHRLAFTWAWEDENGAPGPETEVIVNFASTPGGTRLTLLHQRFASKQARDRHDAGWSSSFDRMARIAG